MKKIVIFSMLIFAAHSIKAQIQLDDFYKQGTSWCESERLGTGHGVYVYAYHSFFINSDTVINNILYHKLNYYNQTLGAIRVSSDTVFFLRLKEMDVSDWTYTPDFICKHPLGTESILYKFDLKVGDSLDWKNEAKTVTGIDNITLSNGAIVKRYLFANGYNEWVWGIGGNKGLFGGRFSFGFPTQAKYYYSHWVAYNFVANEEASCIPNSMEEILTQTKSAFNIYPNPLTGNTLHITSIGIEKLVVTDMTGKVVYATEHLPSGDNILTVNLPQGVYILKAQLMGGSTEVRKIIKE